MSDENTKLSLIEARATQHFHAQKDVPLCILPAGLTSPDGIDCSAPRALDGRGSIRSLHLFQRAAAAYECPSTFSDAGMHDAVCEILDVDHRRLVRFLPTDQEDPWPDGRDRNLHGLRGPLEGTRGGRERHHRLRFEVEMVDPTPEMCFIHVADSWKVASGT